MSRSAPHRTARFAAVAVLAALAVSACSRKAEEQPEAPAAPPPPEAVQPTPPPPPPPPKPKPKHAAAVVQDTPLAADAQMQEDAAAVGMTSAHRDANTTSDADPGADQDRPAGNTVD